MSGGIFSHDFMLSCESKKLCMRESVKVREWTVVPVSSLERGNSCGIRYSGIQVFGFSFGIIYGTGGCLFGCQDVTINGADFGTILPRSFRRKEKPPLRGGLPGCYLSYLLPPIPPPIPPASPEKGVPRPIVRAGVSILQQGTKLLPLRIAVVKAQMHPVHKDVRQ